VKRSLIGNTALISILNHRLVLQAVRVMQPTFRADISRRTGLKPATITTIVESLLRRKMLREVRSNDANSSRAGRPPMMLEVNSDARRVIAIDLEPTRVRVARTDLLARPIQVEQESINPASEPGPTIRRIVSLARSLMRSIPRATVLGIGLSIPGMIDQATGTILCTPHMPKWKNVAIAAALHKALCVPVRIERSVHLAALYERWIDPRHDELTTLVLWLRSGVRMSLIHRGRLSRNGNGLWGEIGHAVIDVNGPPCTCGGRGCLETFVGASAITQRGRELLLAGHSTALNQRVNGDAERVSPQVIFELAAEGEDGCIAIVRDVGRYLGIAVANMINILAPDQVVLSGMNQSARQILLEAVQEQVNSQALSRSREAVTVSMADENDQRALLGAAVLIAQELFELPDLRQRA
jgi:N-acetylglucosamine repressor